MSNFETADHPSEIKSLVPPRSSVEEEAEAMCAVWSAVRRLDYDARGRVAAWLEMRVESVRSDAAEAGMVTDDER